MEKNSRPVKFYQPPSALASLLWLMVIYVLFAWFVSHSPLLNQLRWDVTEDQLFTLSPGTRNILNEIQAPIQLRIFFSPEITKRYPTLRAYRERVGKLLEEMRLFSHGRLQIHQVQPAPFSREEDLAFSHGLKPMPGTETSQPLFFGISGTNELDGLETLPLLKPEQEPFLEYQLARMVERLLNSHAPRQVALLSQVPDAVLQDRENPYGMGIAFHSLPSNVHMQTLSLPLKPLSAEVDLVLLIHPPSLDAQSVAAIRDYVAHGGKLAVFVDPLLVTPTPLGVPPRSDLSGLANILGVDFDATQVLVDTRLPANGRDRGKAKNSETISPVLMVLRGQAIDRQDILTADLQRIHLVAAGFFDQRWDTAQASQRRVLWHDNARFRPVKFSQWRDSQTHGEQPLSADARQPLANHPLAIRLTPPVVAGRESGARRPPSGATAVPGGTVLVADVDWLLNHAWTQRSMDTGQVVYRAFADNGAFFRRLVDHLSSDADLIGIPSRHHIDRPFTTVATLREQSEKKFRQTEQHLIQQLRETERELNKWQQGKAPEDKLIMTPEQQRELQRFRQVKLDIREKLRAVRRNFNQDVAALGRMVLILNLTLVPVLLGVVGIISWRWRRRRLKKTRFSS